MWRDLRFAVLMLLALIAVVALYLGRPMLVFGSVYNAAGQPVAGAFSYSDSRFYSFARDWAEDSRSNMIISGCLFCAALEVRVRADGFESEHIRVSPHHEADTGDRVELQQFLFGTINWARVTLVEAPNVEPLAYEARLITRAARPEAVLALHPQLSGRARFQDLGLRIRELTRGRELEAPFVALSMDSGDGASIQVTLNGIDGGFIIVPPMAGVPRQDAYRETYRRLREAPDSGYLSKVTLDLQDAHFDGDTFFFYCRIGDRYGKGRLSRPFSPRSKPDELSATIRIHLNADGGRALPRGF